MSQRLKAGNQPPLVAAHHDQILSDLRWCFTSPDLLQAESGVAVLAEKDWNQHADVFSNLENSGDLVENPHRRLGIYFEQLIAAGLTHLDGYEMLAHSVQIHTKGITQGELDYIIKLPDDRVLHIEVAIKLYLGIGDTTQAEQWLGPNSIDRLDLKVATLKNRQLPIAQTEAALQTLEKKFGSDFAIDNSYALVKGFLFHPYAEQKMGDIVALPDAVNPNHSQGWWLHYQALHNLKTIAADFGITRWAVLYKPWWLTTAANRCRLLDYTGIMNLLDAHFTATQSAILIVGFTADNDAEVTRGFIVPNHWPGDGKTAMSEHYTPHD